MVGEDENAAALLKAAIAPFAVNKSVVHLTDSEAVAQNLPPVLAETVPNLPALKEKKSVAIVCTNFACQPPMEDPEELSQVRARRDCGKLSCNRNRRTADPSLALMPDLVSAATLAKC